jgi:uncharacterized protein (TIGR02145 family)
MQEKQLLSRLNVAEQRIVDLYHKVKSTDNGGGSITVNGRPNITNLNISPISTAISSSGEISLTIDVPDPLPYKAYRAKIAMQTVAWPGYGYLYNWYAVDDSRNIANPNGGTGLTAPNEWRVPSDTDWDTLVTFAGGSSVAGGKLKSTLTSTAYPFYGWLSNGGGTDDYNFNALSGGYRNFSGTFSLIGNDGFWWSSSEYNTTSSWFRNLHYNGGGAGRYFFYKDYGFSVRLVREATASELLLNDGDTSDTSSLDPYTGNDGKTYVTVKIDTQIWLAQNLRETKYNDNSDIFNASALFGGNFSQLQWQIKGTAQEGAWTAYAGCGVGGGCLVEYDPTTVKLFYNDVLENTLDGGLPLWVAFNFLSSPVYTLTKGQGLNWNKTHIKITSGYDVSDFPIVNERSFLIQEAIESTSYITFRPTKRDNTGAITIEDLDNYNDLLEGVTSYVYVEILEYTPTPYYGYGNDGAGIGISNL